MRQLVEGLSEEDAARFADYLLTLGVATRVDQGPGGATVWVRDENRLPAARAALEEFRLDPNAEKFRDAGKSAREIRKQNERKDREHARNTVVLRDRWGHRDPKRTPLTLALILLSVVGFGVTQFAPLWELRLLLASPVPSAMADSALPRDGWTVSDGRVSSNLVADLRHGEIWRLITPIFLHFGPFHLLFNALWIYDLGGAIEIRRGTIRLAALVVSSAIISNLAQYLFTGSPLFGGLSGVVFALFGYVWMKGMYEPESGLGIHRTTVTLMFLYLAVGLSGGLNTPIAHAAHVSGLIYGILVGVAPHLFQTRSAEP